MVPSYCSFGTFLDFPILYSVFLHPVFRVPSLWLYPVLGSLFIQCICTVCSSRFCSTLYFIRYHEMLSSIIPCSFLDVPFLYTMFILCGCTLCVGILVYHESIHVLVGSTSVRPSISGIPWNISRFSSVFKIPVPADTGEIYHSSSSNYTNLSNLSLTTPTPFHIFPPISRFIHYNEEPRFKDERRGEEGGGGSRFQNEGLKSRKWDEGLSRQLNRNGLNGDLIVIRTLYT